MRGCWIGMGLTCLEDSAAATECCVFGDFCRCWSWFVDGGAPAWTGSLVMFIWLDPMQRDIVASDFGFDFVAAIHLVGSWCLTSVRFLSCCYPKTFCSDWLQTLTTRRNWTRRGFDSIALILIFILMLMSILVIGFGSGLGRIGMGWLWFDFDWFPLICCACDFNFETLFLKFCVDVFFGFKFELIWVDLERIGLDWIWCILWVWFGLMWLGLRLDLIWIDLWQAPRWGRTGRNNSKDGIGNDVLVWMSKQKVGSPVQRSALFLTPSLPCAQRHFHKTSILTRKVASTKKFPNAPCMCLESLKGTFELYASSLNQDTAFQTMVPCERRTQGWGHSKNYACHALSFLQVWSVHSCFSKLDHHPVSPRVPELILKLGLLVT